MLLYLYSLFVCISNGLVFKVRSLINRYLFGSFSMIPHLLPSVLAALQQGVVVVSPERRVLFANEVFCSLVHPGLTPEQLLGQSGQDLVGYFKEVFMEPTAFMERLLAIYEKGEPVVGEIIRLRDGRLLSRDHTPIRENGRIVAHVWVYQEVLSRLANEEHDIQRVLNRFISTLYEQETEEAILWEVARNCIAYLNFFDCVIYMLDESRGVLMQQAAWGPKSPNGEVVQDYIEIPLGKGIVGSVAQTGRAEVIGDVTQDPRYISDKITGLSEITVPIFSKGQVIGIIDSEHTQKNFFTNKHLSVLTTLAAVVGIKITQIRERLTRQAEIEKQRLFYEQILNNIPADIAVFNKDHRYLFVNPQGIQNPEIRNWILGKTDEEYCDYRGRPYTIFEARRKAFNQAIETRRQSEWEEELIRPNGIKENHYRKMFPVVNEEGVVDLVIGYGMNVTTIKQAQAVLERAKEEAEANAQAKEDFLARVSHELRTPMNGILGLTDLLGRTSLDEKQVQYAQLLRQSAKSLVAIVNEVLDIEKIGSGKMELHPEVFNLRDRMQGLLDLCDEQAHRKGLSMLLYIEDALSVSYCGDVNRIGQILGNLLSNALKFTDTGSVELRVTPGVEGGVCFRVADTGIGIAPDSLDRIFEPFVQARAEGQSVRPGTGLGLTICRELAGLMGGKVEVVSEPGIGSTFSLCLPLEPVEDSIAETSLLTAADVSGMLRGKRMLLVEDVSLNRFLVEEMTRDWGIVLDLAVDGVEGLQMATENLYDLILMDIQMPVMDGIQSTRSIRQLSDPAHARVPIVALSANAFESDRRNYLQAGMNDALFKPFDAIQLREVLLRALGGGIDVQVVSYADPMGKAPGLQIDLSYLRRVGNGNPMFIKTILNSFVESADEISAEMERMLVLNDRKGIGEAVHKVKFALGVVGVTVLKDVVAFMEGHGKGSVELAEGQAYKQAVSGFIRDLRRLKEQAKSMV